MPQQSDTIKYSLTDSGSLDNDHWAIRIDSGEFQSVLFQFMHVSIDEINEGTADAEAKIHFTYAILDDEFGLADENPEGFEKEIAKILQSVMLESIGEEYGSNGDNYTQESGTQRPVHEEGVSVSEI